jgi:predicted aminopeptidase
MTLDDCDLPDVRDWVQAVARSTEYAYKHRLMVVGTGLAGAALEALYQKWCSTQAERDKAEAECDRLRATYLALRQQRESDAAVAAPVAAAGRPRSGKQPS